MKNKWIRLLLALAFLVAPVSFSLAGAESEEEEIIKVEWTYPEALQIVNDILSVFVEGDEEVSEEPRERGQAPRTEKRAKPKKEVCWGFYKSATGKVKLFSMKCS